VSSFPRLYLVSPARLRAGGLADLVPDLAGAGVDIIQLRDKEMEAGDLLRVGEPVREACREAGVPFIVNDRPDVALALDADGVHLGQNDLPASVARRILGEDVIVGRSTHAPEEVDRELASTIRLDYIAVGPVAPTPTKPGRPGTGLELVTYASERAELPWFVTGGMSPDTLPAAMEAGARRIVVVRALVEADDPVEVAARLRGMLDERPV
jgi:thiamine-phosphate pyrophosphorylase